MSDTTNTSDAKVALNSVNSVFSGVVDFFGNITKNFYNGLTTLSTLDYKDATNAWSDGWNDFINSWSSYTSDMLSDDTTNKEKISATGSIALDTAMSALNAVGLAVGEGLGTVSYSLTYVMNNINDTFTSVEKTLTDAGTWAENVQLSTATTLTSIVSMLGGSGTSTIVSVITKALQVYTQSLVPYQDGVSETTFGGLMENSWSKGSDSFINYIEQGSGSYKINVLTTTPLDPGDNSSNLYGTMLLGTPPVFNHISDPRNRAITSTFLRDAKFISLTPGYPKYNGSSYLQATADDQMHQTTTGESMMQYLLTNGLNSNFTNKDRRYYTFATAYDDYYAYLETMLNTLWIKMGLSNSGTDTFTMYSFFQSLDSSTVKSQYNRAIGFYVNPTSALTESINNSQTGTGSELAATVNSNSETFQRLNYLTGMGTGGTVRNAANIASKTMQTMSNLKNFVSSTFSSTISGITSGSGLLSKVTGGAKGLLSDTNRFLTEQDNGVVIQSFATTNGMQVTYPELWRESNYMKSVNIDFEFISPYGDPLSVFQYVVVPFCALICFAMPRQAADNGLVSPFFVRADMPGYFTSDLALISDFNWTKGGSNNLWTKDGIPRAISGSFTLSDLYPFLAMTKRISFLSANPNYTVWLDNLAGLHAVYDSDENSLNDYWSKMLSHVTGDDGSTSLWNTYNSDRQDVHTKFAQNGTTTDSYNKNNYTKESSSEIPWFRAGR